MINDANFLKIIKTADPEYNEDDITTTGFIDTGSYALNALCSASIYGGLPNNRVTAFAGASGVGKTFFALSGIRQFLEENPDGRVIYFDSEFAIEPSMLEKRGIDKKRVFILQPETIQKFKTTALNILEGLDKEKNKIPVLMVLDSLGNLPTNKEIEDGMSGKDVSDMTRAKLIRSIFRTLCLKLGKTKTPMILTNHTYASIGAYVPTQTMGGGGGVVYAASTIVMLSKAQDKNGNEIVGGIITAKTEKSRYSREKQKVKLKLSFSTGLDRYYGLLDIAEEAGIFKKVSTRYELPDGSKQFGSRIEANPEKFFTQEILDKIDAYCRVRYALGVGEGEEKEPEIDEETGEIIETSEVNDESEE